MGTPCDTCMEWLVYSFKDFFDGGTQGGANTPAHYNPETRAECPGASVSWKRER